MINNMFLLTLVLSSGQFSAIALTEIYSRKEGLVISTEMKKRLEIVKEGGKNSSPYFQ